MGRWILILMHVRIQEFCQVSLISAGLVVKGKKTKNDFLFGEPIRLSGPHLVQLSPTRILVKFFQKPVQHSAIYTIADLLIIELHTPRIEAMKYCEEVFHVAFLLEVAPKYCHWNGEVLNPSVIMMQRAVGHLDRRN